MKVHYSVLIAISTAALFRAQPVAGQVLGSGGLDTGVGIGDGRGGEFVDRTFAAAHVDLSGVIPLAHNVGGFATLAYDWFGLITGHGDVCRVRPANPSSGCIPTFPTGGGSSFTVGGVLALGTAIEFRAGLGAGAFSLDKTRVGAVLVEGEAAFFPVASFGIVARTRTVEIPRYRGDRLSLAHWLLGVRLRRSASRSVKPNER